MRRRPSRAFQPRPCAFSPVPAINAAFCFDCTYTDCDPAGCGHDCHA